MYNIDKGRETWIKSHVLETLNNEEFEPYFQPIIRTVSGEICDYEALARWNDTEIGCISPREFIPVLESMRLSYRLDELILKKVLIDLRKRLDAGFSIQPVSVNL